MTVLVKEVRTNLYQAETDGYFYHGRDQIVAAPAPTELANVSLVEQKDDHLHNLLSNEV